MSDLKVDCPNGTMRPNLPRSAEGAVKLLYPTWWRLRRKHAESRSGIRALRSGSVSQAAFKTAFGNNIADFKPLLVRTSTTSYCSGDSRPRHLANDSMRQVKPFCSAYATSAALLSNFLECIDGCFVMPTSLNWYVWAVTLSLWDEGGITRKFY